MTKMYTTISGNSCQLTPKLWRGIKILSRKRFDGSKDLFESCWRQYRTFLIGAIDNPKDISDVLSWLDKIASEKVNDSKNRFYIGGK